jgi:hypothetical protein
MTITGAIAATLCLGLFVIQVTTAALRGHPVALGRALSGLLISFVGSALALAATRVLLGAVDSLSLDPPISLTGKVLASRCGDRCGERG